MDESDFGIDHFWNQEYSKYVPCEDETDHKWLIDSQYCNSSDCDRITATIAGECCNNLCKFSTVGWNVKAGGAEQPIQPTPPTQIAANNHPPNLPPPSYNSIYPQIPNPVAPSAPYVLQPVQNNMQIPGPGTSTIQSTIQSSISPQMQNILSHGQSMLPQQLQDAAAQVQTVISSGLSNNPFWLPASEGQVPPGAVIGGHEVGGEKLYVARARHAGALIPGKVSQRIWRAFFRNFNGKLWNERLQFTKWLSILGFLELIHIYR